MIYWMDVCQSTTVGQRCPDTEKASVLLKKKNWSNKHRKRFLFPFLCSCINPFSVAFLFNFIKMSKAPNGFLKTETQANELQPPLAITIRQNSYKSFFGVTGDSFSVCLICSSFNSYEWPRQNFSLQYNIKQTNDENKDRY